MTHTRATCTLGRERCTPTTPAQQIHCVARHSRQTAREIVDELQRLGVACSYDWFIKVTSDSGRAVAPAWLLLALAAVTGRTSHLAYLAHEAGLLTFQPPFGPSASRAALSPLVRQFASVVEEWEAMHADGQISAQEAHDYTHVCTEFAALLLGNANEVRQRAGLPCLSTLSKEPAV